MKKSILFLILFTFISVNLYAEELHYHEEMFCLKPDGTPNGETSVQDGVTYITVPDGAGQSSDEIKKQSLQEVYAQIAKYNKFPEKIPSKKTTYNLHGGALIIEVEPVSKTQVLITFFHREASTREPTLLTYYPDKKITRQTDCIDLP